MCLGQPQQNDQSLSTMEVHSHHLGPPLQHQVFVNFRGLDLRFGFLLVEALQRHGINVFIDSLERKGEDLINLFARIEESTIALVIFSKRYTESIWERKAAKSTTSCDGARDLKKPWCGDGRRSYRGWWRWNPARRRR
uniref:TIR domain-containing protein n=1 Tax=Brassica oleracea var. oleracea TaxID=109376 RepID=A0A0D3D964_BRAOL